MKAAIDKTERRRAIQEYHNLENDITPEGIVKNKREMKEVAKALEFEKTALRDPVVDLRQIEWGMRV